MKRLSATFCNGEYSVFNGFSYAGFPAYWTLKTKSNKTCECQPDELDDNLMENNHEEYSFPQEIRLMISVEIMKCRRIRQILWYYVPNKL